MSIETELKERSGGHCELCDATENLAAFEVQPARNGDAGDYAYLCAACIEQVENPEKMEPDRWRCLNNSMWSTVPAVQVLAWRILNQLKDHGWPQELLDMLYLDEDTMAWATAATGDKIVHRDANGAVLQAGDTVVLTQDLKVKGGGFTAKRGTAVRRISLVADNPEQIEGRVEDQRIVILTKYVRKK